MSFGDGALRSETYRTGGLGGFSLPFDAIGPAARLADGCLIVLTSVATGFLYAIAMGLSDTEPVAWIGVGLAMAAPIIIVLNQFHIYGAADLLAFRRQATRVLGVWTATFVFLTFLAFATKSGAMFSRGAVLSFALAGPLVLLGARVFWHVALTRAFASGALVARKIAVIAERAVDPGSERAGAFDANKLRILQQFTLPSDPGALPAFLDDMTAGLRGSDVEEVYICAEWARWGDRDAVLRRLRALPLPVRLVPDASTSALFNRPWQDFGGSVAVELQRAPISVTERGFKRGLDLLIGSLALVVALPALLVAAIAIRCESKGPVLFQQKRLGFNGRSFTILKLRSMTANQEGARIEQARRGDARVTRVGRFLRRWSLDELPQLVNVIRGDMSIVGPRPHAVAHDVHYDALIANYAMRHHMRPGLTGWAQVHGLRGATPTVDVMERRLHHDLWYVDHWSIWLDLRILLRTGFQVLRGEGAY